MGSQIPILEHTPNDPSSFLSVPLPKSSDDPPLKCTIASKQTFSIWTWRDILDLNCSSHQVSLGDSLFLHK